VDTDRVEIELRVPGVLFFTCHDSRGCFVIHNLDPEGPLPFINMTQWQHKQLRLHLETLLESLDAFEAADAR
jgi:hypothetical protein